MPIISLDIYYYIQMLVNRLFFFAGRKSSDSDFTAFGSLDVYKIFY